MNVQFADLLILSYDARRNYVLQTRSSLSSVRLSPTTLPTLPQLCLHEVDPHTRFILHTTLRASPTFIMPPKNATRTPAQRMKAAADRKRQRENLKRKAENKPTLKTPRQLEQERRAAAGELVGAAKWTAEKAKKTVKTTAESEVGTNDDDSGTSDDENDEQGKFINKKGRKTGQYQRQPKEDDENMEMDFIVRDGVPVPRLSTIVELTPELLADKNGIELANILERQSNATIYEMLSKLQVCISTIASMLH